MIYRNTLYMLLAIFLFGCQAQEKKSVKQKVKIDESTIMKHLKTLSSDEFEGRMPCARQDQKTVDYLVDYYKTLGLSPANGTSYTQDVDLLDIVGYPSDYMDIVSAAGDYKLKKSDDFVIHSYRKTKQVSLEESELVFCGYGIVAPELGWNDYEGLDMKGKTAVVLINDPDFGVEDTTQHLFDGEAMTYYGRWTYKYEEADRQGADGLLIIHETASAGYPWFVIQSSWSGPQQSLSGIDRSNDCPVKGWISLDVAKRLFKDANLDIASEIRSARQKGFKAKSLDAKASVKIDNEYKECTSKNVVAYIPGASKPDEYIVYTAHWDHLGVGTAVEGDTIYNGALDNATGCAAVMSIAEAFSKGDAPDRSVVFLMVTAEEQGLLGSEYYVNKPCFPLNKTVCNLNMDGVNPCGAMNDLTITGMGHSEMDDYAKAAAEAQGRYVIGEQEPEKGYFFRSDHFNFAKFGVPALYAEGGYDHREKGKDYAKAFKQDFLDKRYHAPSDEYDPEEWDLSGFLEDTELYYNIGFEIANSDDWPKWKKGSEFSRK